MRRLQDYEKSSSRKYERLWFLFTSENSTWTSSTGTERPEEPVRVDEVDIWSWSSFGFSIFWKTTKYGYEILTSNEIPSKRPIFVYSHLWNIYIVLSTDLHVLSVKSDALRVKYEKGWLDLDINIHFLQFRHAHTLFQRRVLISQMRHATRDINNRHSANQICELENVFENPGILLANPSAGSRSIGVAADCNGTPY